MPFFYKKKIVAGTIRALLINSIKVVEIEYEIWKTEKDIKKLINT